MRIASVDDFENERSRHGDFVPRQDVLEKIKRILDGEKPMARGWLPLFGGPGVGKTAILLQLLETLEGALVFFFIRRGSDGRDRPEVVERSLCAQIKQLYPECSGADSPSEMRLSDLLTMLSKRVLGPHNERLILVIDGLDELALDAPGGNSLPRFLPEVPPKGVVILCATRPKDPQRNWLLERANVPPIDLDDKELSASNHYACQLFWERHIDEFSPPLERNFVEAAVERSAGNLLYAIRLRDWLIDKPLHQRVTVNIPRGLDAFLERIWEDFLALDEPRCNVVLEGLGVACAAREAVPPSLFSPILGWTSRLDVEQLLRAARPFLREVEAAWHNHIKAYRLYHEWLREFIITKLGDSTMRGHHAQISRSLAAWPPSEGDPPKRLYALRHAVTHHLESGDVEAAQRLCVDVSYLQRKWTTLGVAAVERDLEATVRSVSGDAAFNLSAILAAVSAEASSLRDDSTSLATRLYNRLRCAGWSAHQIESVLQFSDGKLPPMRLRHCVRIGATQLRSFIEHERPVVACAMSPDGQHLLSASADQTLRLWSLERSECVKVLRGHKDEVTSCALTINGKTAISTSTDFTTKLWDVESGSCTGELTHDTQAPTACAFIRDDELFVVGFEDGTLRAWNRHSRNLVETLYGHTAYVTACVRTPNGKHFVTTSRDETVRVWDLVSFELLHTLQRKDDPDAPSVRGSEGRRWFTSLALSSDGKTVFVASGDGTISHWNVVAGTPINTFRVANGRIDSCAVSPEGYLLCGLADGTMLVWSLAEGKCIDRLSAHTAAVSACALTRDGRRAVSASHDRSLKLWDLSAFGSVPREIHAASITACAMTPDDSIAVSASEDGILKVWELATGKRRVNLKEHEAWVTACALSTNGLRVVSGALDGNLRVWNVPTAMCIQSVQGHTDRIINCAILARDLIISASHDGWIKIWKLTDLAHIRTLGEHDALECFAVRADGASALSVSRDGTAKLWNLATYDCERTLEDLGSGILCCALTPDGGRAVVGREDGAIEFYDIASGQSLEMIRGHEGRVIACAVSTDGTKILATFEYETLRVFRLDTYTLVAKLQGNSKFRCVTTTNGLICAGADDGNLWMIESGMESSLPVKQPTQKRAVRPKVTKKSDEDSSADIMGNAGVRNPGPDATSKPSRPRRSSLLARLREILARLYPAVEDARMIVDETELDAGAIDLGGSALQFWYAVLTAAENHVRLEELASVVAQKNHRNDELVALLRTLKLIK